MMKVLVTGGNGQLGSELRELAKDLNEFTFIFTDVEELDICDAAAVDSFILEQRPDVIVNCAGYTAVDKAETDQKKAFDLNAEAIGNLCRGANTTGAGIIHLSTDFIFDGKKDKPYKEDDEPRPASVYGKSKSEGEKIFLEGAKSGLIIRTSWLYSSYGKNFVKTIDKLTRERETLKVVNDQKGSPTYAHDLAKVILAVIKKELCFEKPDIYHYANKGECTWYEFAREIVRNNGSKCHVVPITSKEFNAPAGRPAYSVMDTSKIRKALGITIPDWKESLRVCMGRLRGKRKA